MSLFDRLRFRGTPWTGPVKGANTDALNQGLWSVPVGQGDLVLPRTVALYEGYTRDCAAIYREQPAVRYTVDFVARNVAQVPLRAFRRADEFERERLPEHPFNEFIKRPAPEYTEYTFKRDLVTDLLVFDVAYYAKVRSPRGNGFALVRLFPDAVSFIGGDSTGPEKFRETYADGTYKDWERDDVLWLHGYGGRRGISPLETLRRILAEDDAAGRHKEGLYRNGMRQAGVILRPLDAGEWSDQARQRFLEQMAGRYTGGANAGKPLLLEEGMQWQGDQFKLDDAEYIKGREFTMKAVAHAFHIAPQMLGLEGAPYASISAYNAQLYQNTLAPLLVFLTEEIEAQLLPEFEADPKVYVEFNLEAKLRGSFEEQAAILTRAVGGPWMTPNEARALRDLPPREGGDELLQGGGGVQPAASADDGDDADVVELEAASRSPRGKARRQAPGRRDQYAKQLENVLLKTFERQRRQVEARKALPDRVRWDRELRDDLLAVTRVMVAAEGARKAAQLGGKFDTRQLENYLGDGAFYVARNVNSDIGDALMNTASSEHVYGVLAPAMAARVAKGLASHLFSFAREEAGKQAGAKVKTWTVTNAKSRHPNMNGQQAPLGQPFSNGLQYPGDPSADPDETAGCECLLDVE